MGLKPANKETAVGTIPADWDCVTVADVGARVKNAIVGGPFGSDLVSRDYVPAGVPVIRGQNMGEHWVGGDFVFVTEAKARSLSANLARPSDVVFTQRGTLGQVSVVPAAPYERYLVSQSQMKLTVESSQADPRFYYHQFTGWWHRKYFVENAIQTGVPHLNLGILRRVPITRPPLAEQRLIANVLDDIDASLENQQRVIAKKRDLKQAAMQRLLTGEERLSGYASDRTPIAVRELGAFYGGLAGKTAQDFGVGDARYVPFLSVMNRVEVDCDRLERVRVRHTEVQNRVLEGDLLFNGSSETPEEVAMCAIVPCHDSDVYLNSFCFGLRLRPDCRALGLYLAYLFRSGVGRNLVRSLAQGATRYNVSKAALGRLEVTLPSLDEQRAIADVLSDMDAELAALEQRLAKTRALKQAMMQDLLTGRTRLVSTDADAR